MATNKAPASASASSPPAAAVRLHHQNDIYKIEIENGHHMNVFMPSSQIILESTEAAAAAITTKKTDDVANNNINTKKRGHNCDEVKADKQQQEEEDGSSSGNITTTTTNNNNKVGGEELEKNYYIIPESVRQYERQLRKIQAAQRASTPLSSSLLLNQNLDDIIVYNDSHIVVVNKPSGVLTVPGVNNNPNILSLLYETMMKNKNKKKGDDDDDDESLRGGIEKMEHMIVHRLDMDTSGIVIFAKTKDSMTKLQASFRRDDNNNNNKKKKYKNKNKKYVDKQQENSKTTVGHVQKVYEALLCGHLNPIIQTGKIDLPLQRDHRFPPFVSFCCFFLFLFLNLLAGIY